MDILNKPIQNFTFNDVVSFCQENIREGIQLDYKRELPQDGLAKYFAAFSNTRGGVIIIGVEEDRQTGIPSAWNGIANNAQSIERIHQWASNVDPLPNYEVHATDTQNGNFFILIRVFEGDRNPYYVQNDARVYVRTGNITPSIDIASPEMLELLFGKKEKAKLARNLYISRAQEVYQAGLRRAERERLKKISAEKEEYEKKKQQWIADGDPVKPFRSVIYQKGLGSEASIFTTVIQPFFPNKSLLNPPDIKSKIIEIRDSDMAFRLNFPSLNPEAIPDGIMYFEWGHQDGTIKNEQFYSTGLVRLSFDVLRVDSEQNRDVYIVHILSLLFQVLKAAGNFYRLASYQGGLKGYISIENVEGVLLQPGLAGRPFFMNRDQEGLLDEYRLELDLDTSLLNDNRAFQEYFFKIIKEVHWMFGYEEISDQAITQYLQERNWLVQ